MNQGFYIKIGEETYYEGIDSGSMHLSEILCEKDVEFCTFCSNKFEVRLFGVEDVSGQPIEVKYVDENDYVTYVFAGWVDTAKQTVGGEYREIVAYDALYKYRDVDVISWWDSFWTSHTTATAPTLLNSLLEYMYNTYGLVSTFTVSGWAIPMTKTDGLHSATFGYMLNQLALGSGVKGIFSVDRIGRLRLIGYPNKGSVISAGNYKLVSDNVQSDSTYEEYVTAHISCVKLVDATGQIGITSGTPTDGEIYVVKPSICWMNASTQTMSNLVGPFLSELSGNMLRYTPANLNMILPDFGIQLGDTVKTEKGYHFVTAIEFSGPQLVNQTIISTGSANREDMSTVDIPVTDTADSIVKKINLSANEVKIEANSIDLNGYTDINGYFSVDESGKVSLKDCDLQINTSSTAQDAIRLNYHSNIGGVEYDYGNESSVGKNTIFNEETDYRSEHVAEGLNVYKISTNKCVASISRENLVVDGKVEAVKDAGNYVTISPSGIMCEQGTADAVGETVQLQNGRIYASHNINTANGHGLYIKDSAGTYRGVAAVSGSTINFGTGGFVQNTVNLGSANTSTINIGAGGVVRTNVYGDCVNIVEGLRSATPVCYDTDLKYPMHLVTGNGTTIAADTNLNTLTTCGTYNINNGTIMSSLGNIGRVVTAFGTGGARVEVIHTNSPHTNLTGGIMQRIISQWGNGTYERFLPWTTGATWSHWRCVAPFVKNNTVSAKSASWTNIVTGIVSPQAGDAYDVSITMPAGYARYVFHYGTAWSGQRYVTIGSNIITLQMSGTNLQIKTQSDTTGKYNLIMTPLF